MTDYPDDQAPTVTIMIIDRSVHLARTNASFTRARKALAGFTPDELEEARERVLHWAEGRRGDPTPNLVLSVLNPIVDHPLAFDPDWPG